MSQTVTIEEGRAYVFVAVEHANSEIIGIHAARSANRFEALEPVRQGVYRIGASAPSRPAWRVGSSCVTIMAQLHVRRFPERDQMSGHRSFAVLRARTRGQWRRRSASSETLKENLLWVRTFKAIEELRAELVAFARRYNETWLVARHGYKTPARVRKRANHATNFAIDPTLAAALPLAA